VKIAEQKKLLLAEAMWTRYMPMRKALDGILASNVIGKIHSLSANLGYPITHVERIMKKSMGGGALLDVGCYTIHFAFMVFGSDKIKSINAVATHGGADNVDTSANITLLYEDGKTALLHPSVKVRTDRRGMIFGEKGYIEFLNINNCEGIRVFDTDDRLIVNVETPKQISGFEYQVESCRKAIEAGKTECPELPHSEIIKVMETMDKIRAAW
jgi:predicted dehydrogenase